MRGPPPRLTATDGAADPGRPAATAKTTTGSASSPAHSGPRRSSRSGCLACATLTASRQRITARRAFSLTYSITQRDAVGRFPSMLGEEAEDMAGCAAGAAVGAGNEYDARCWHPAARVHDRGPTPQSAIPRAGSARRRTGIEPAGDAARRPPVLKTGGATRHPDASGADVTRAQAARAIRVAGHAGPGWPRACSGRALFLTA
jgi:hypothetical protein